MPISLPMLRQTLAITPVVFATFMSGMSLGWLPPILKNYRNSTGDFSLTDNQCSWMISLHYLGHFTGCILLISIVDRFGRNSAIILSEILIVLCWTGVTLTRTASLHLLIRWFTGLSMGLIISMNVIYIGENSSPNLRAVFGSCTSLFFYGGMLIGCSIATYYPYETTAYILVALSLANLLSGVLLREPAQYLLAKGRIAEAANQFFRLRGKDEKTQKEFDDIKSNLAVEIPKFSLSVVLNRHFQITCSFTVLIYFTGYPAVNPLVSLILSPTEQFSTNELAILFQLFQLVGAIVSPFIIDCFGRRTLCMLSAICVALTHFVTAALYFARGSGFKVPVNEWLLFGSITAYGAIFSATLFPLGLIARAELLPQRFRTTGSSISSILNSLTSVLVGQSFFWITANFGIEINFVCYAVFSLTILVFCYLYLPETKGLSLTEIEKLENPRSEATNS